MGRYDVEQRVAIVAGPHRRCTGITATHYDPGDPSSRAEVLVRLDTSERVVSVLACELRPVVYGADSSGLEEAT
jgi:hypothetical protein